MNILVYSITELVLETNCKKMKSLSIQFSTTYKEKASVVTECVYLCQVEDVSVVVRL